MTFRQVSSSLFLLKALHLPGVVGIHRLSAQGQAGQGRSNEVLQEGDAPERRTR